MNLSKKIYINKFSIHFLFELERLFENVSVKNESNAFIDFFLILLAVKTIRNSELFNKLDNTLRIELFSIRDTIISFNPDLNVFLPSNIPLLKSRLEYLKLTIKNLKNS